MARTRTRAEMVAQALALADAGDSENTDATGRVTFLNQAIAGLWGQLVSADPSRYARRSVLTVASNTLEYDFADAAAFSPAPTDMMSVLGASYVRSSPYREVPLDRFAFAERGVWDERDLAIPNPGQIVRWDVRYQGQDGSDARFVFDRQPEVGATYWVYTIRSAPELEGDGEVFDGINGWEDEAVYTTAILLLQAEESDTSALMMERETIRARIKGLAPKRVAGRSKVVASVWWPGSTHRYFPR